MIQIVSGTLHTCFTSFWSLKAPLKILEMVGPVRVIYGERGGGGVDLSDPSLQMKSSNN
jgi:hypothetical protein